MKLLRKIRNEKNRVKLLINSRSSIYNQFIANSERTVEVIENIEWLSLSDFDVSRILDEEINLDNFIRDACSKYCMPEDSQDKDEADKNVLKEIPSIRTF